VLSLLENTRFGMASVVMGMLAPGQYRDRALTRKFDRKLNYFYPRHSPAVQIAARRHGFAGRQPRLARAIREPAAGDRVRTGRNVL
jgi:hypothetical protein